MTRMAVRFRVPQPGQADREYETAGQTARALLALVEAGMGGITALEVSSWALRLAAYCHRLRREFGLEIRTEREPHTGGWHGRHVLETPVRIVAIEQAAPRDAKHAHAIGNGETWP